MKPDIVFCHGPFLSGDYRVGETLVAQSAKVLHLCNPQTTMQAPPETSTPPSFKDKLKAGKMNEKLTTLIHRTKSQHPPSSEPQARTPSPPPILQQVVPPPRRLAVLLLGLKPHRLGLWTSSARPSESVLQYIILNGAPTLVLPALSGSPLIAWNTLTLKQLQAKHDKYDGVVRILFEYLSLCVDWERVTVGKSDEDRKSAVRDSLKLVVAAAAQSAESRAVKKGIDLERAGVVFLRIP